MKWTILGSGGCMVIPKPLCGCPVCQEARSKGIPYSRSGPSAFLHSLNLLIDTPAEISQQLNRSNIEDIDYLIFTHLDPDHIEGFRVVEQITLDFRTWHAYSGKRIKLLLPKQLSSPIQNIQNQYSPIVDFFQERGFIDLNVFQDKVRIEDTTITAIPVDRGDQISFIYVFDDLYRKTIYAPCDIKPFPEHRSEVQQADLLIIQPGIFEKGLKHNFKYPSDHLSRSTLYSFEQCF
jgi:phosphoribosyl 1,2-cyclic phosphate phosphodiesterase